MSRDDIEKFASSGGWSLGDPASSSQSRRLKLHSPLAKGAMPGGGELTGIKRAICPKHSKNWVEKSIWNVWQ